LCEFQGAVYFVTHQKRRVSAVCFKRLGTTHVIQFANDTCMCIVCVVMMNPCNLGVGFSASCFVDQLCFLQTEETLVPFCR
jgi:hypothetical protein